MPSMIERVVNWMGLDEIPVSPQLSQMQNVSIKLYDFSEYDEAVSQFVFHADSEFEPIRFCIRDEDRGQSVQLMGQVEPGRGVVVYNMEGEEQFVVALSDDPKQYLGEIRNSGDWTAYKVDSLTENGRTGFINPAINESGGAASENGPLEIRRVKDRWGSISQFFLGSFDSDRYEIRHNGQLLVTITPRHRSSTNSYAIDYHQSCMNASDHIKTVGLGTALLLTLDNGYPPMRNLLRQSMRRKSAHF